MSNNLLELINENITGEVIGKLADFLGESPKNTTSALSNAIPSLLAGLINKSSDSQGASSLFSLLTQGNHDGSILNNLASAFSGGDSTSKLLSMGTSLLNSILGHKTDGVANLVANASGISKTSSSGLLGLLTPMILGVLGKTAKTQGITSASGLANLLASQSGFLRNFLPAGLSSILGTAGLGDAIKSTAPHTSQATYATDDGDDGFGKWLPWLLIPAILALGWGLLKYFKLPEVTAPETSIQQATPPQASIGTAPAIVTPTPIAAPKVEAPVAVTPAPVVTAAPVTPAPATPQATVAVPEAVAPVVEKVGEFFEKTLSSGFALKNAAQNGVENKLIGFIEDTKRTIGEKTWFTMDGIVFDTGKSTIRPESKVQITNIAEIMKAFPAVKIKIGGYTDNTGNPKSNVALSAARAKTVKNALVAGGVKAARIGAEGYGSEHPVASNDDEAGRQKNRRIDVLVTAK